jgi:WD40 repeat protein
MNHRANTSRLIQVAALVLVAAWGPPAGAQDQIRRFTDPILVLDTGGHHGSIRDLEFTPDGLGLISAGRDKVAYLWDLDGRPPGRSGAIRPAIWRGQRGSINALALSPPDADGRRVLALAGNGVENQGGTVSLYRFPGAPGRPTGDLIGYLYSRGAPVSGWTDGHANAIGSMAFAPDGRWLATGSGDGTVKLWDVAGRRVVATLDHQGGRVNALAFAGDDRLVTGTHLGDIRVWDLAPLRRQPAGAAAVVGRVPHLEANPNDPAASAINALDVGTDGRWLVVGHESGDLYRFDLNAAGNLRASAAELPTRQGAAGQGPVEAIAIGPNNVVAVSIVARRSPQNQRPTVECDVEVRDLNGRILPGFSWTATNLVYALAFSPDGKRLAYGGGDEQAITLRDLADAQAAPTAFRGEGFGVWQVGFSADGGRVAFSATHHDRGRPPVFFGFHLDDRSPGSLAGADVVGHRETLDGWAVTPVNPYLLRVTAPPGQAGGFEVALDPNLDQRWWAWTFIPGKAPEHPAPTLAVACGQGVAIYELAGGTRTRFLHGHEGFVYDVAPSPDGKWLATGSADQTVRLWSLKDCDRRPGLGAEFERLDDGTRRVRAVAPRSFAEGMGLTVGDVVEVVGLGREVAMGDLDLPAGDLAGKGLDLSKVARDQAKVDELFGKIDTTAPNTGTNFLVRRRAPGLIAAPGLLLDARGVLGTTRRDGPALSLFAGQDEEWVLWMPRGYYDTSVLGDVRLLGWHLNNATIYRSPVRPTDFLPMERFEALLRAPRFQANNVIALLLQTGDEVQALGARAALDPPRVVVDRQPPELTIRAATADEVPGGLPPLDLGGAAIAPGAIVPPLVVADAGAALGLVVESDATGRMPAQALEVYLDNRPVAPPAAPDLSAPSVRVPVRLEGLGPGLHRLLVLVRNAEGVARPAMVDLEVRAGPAAPPEPEPRRLKVVALAPSFDGAGLPAIPQAESDARDLPGFLHKYLSADAEGSAFAADPAGDVLLVGPNADADAIERAFNALPGGPLDAGDMLVVILETHVLASGSDLEVAGADAAGEPPKPTVPGAAISEALGAVARTGCRVLVLLDGVHGAEVRGREADASEWIRHLRGERGVIVFAASKQGPSRRGDVHRAFAQAVLASAGLRGRFVRADEVRTLGQVRELITAEVLRLTRRVQRPECYIPDSVATGIPLLNPRPRPR